MKRFLFSIAAFSLSVLGFALPSSPYGGLRGDDSNLSPFALPPRGEKGEPEGVYITQVRYAGPFPVRNPVMIDKKDVKASEFDESNLLDIPIKQTLLENGQTIDIKFLPSGGDSGEAALHLIGFNLDNKLYTGVTISVKGIRKYQLFVDGKKQMSGYVRLEPTAHQVVIKYLSVPEKTDSASINVEADVADCINICDYTARHKYNFMDVITAKTYTGASLSHNGKYIRISYRTTATDGKTKTHTIIRETATGRQLADLGYPVYWMPTSNQYYYTEDNPGGMKFICVDPATGRETVLTEGVPRGNYHIAPTEDFLITYQENEGPKEDEGVYQVLQPEDRQPGWRNRTNLLKYDMKTGMVQPLTYGHHNINLSGISNDGKLLLYGTEKSRLTERPTTLYSLYLLNLETMETKCVFEDDGFTSRAVLSPDGSMIAIYGSPEAFGGIGKNVPEGRTPSMTDTQLFLIDVNKSDMNTSNLRCPTKYFNPSVSRVSWNEYDGMLYFTAEDCDSVNLFQLNPKTGRIKEIACSEEVISSFDCASTAPLIAYYGVSASNSNRLHLLNTKTMKSTLCDDLSSENLKNSTLGECHAWAFKNSRGETISGRYYLPADFDASKQYPMIVNYYGGCSPTSRNFESRYPHHAYASLGYVVLVINPSGATGFGQEFSSRHVNTAGEGVAQDIIDGTKQFCKEHAFVNAKKIGCIGASYGGFMTQYLQTVTDIFAAAISHAGISDHTSYWGEGYWGYSYSEVSMANSYPWTDKHLYVDQSPLFNADKIHTPILFLHGDADTNVPVGESIQMFTALKLLGRETAMVLVKGQNHHILDFQKRIKWQNTIFAWFAKYLQDDPTWWNDIYSEKDL